MSVPSETPNLKRDRPLSPRCRFKCGEPALELILLRGPLTTGEERLARSGRKAGRPDRRSAGGVAVDVVVRMQVQARTGKETVLERVTRGELQIGVAEVLVQH